MMSKLLLCFIVGFLVGAVTHEADMRRNCTESGDSNAWFYEIKCEEMKDKTK